MQGSEFEETTSTIPDSRLNLANRLLTSSADTDMSACTQRVTTWLAQAALRPLPSGVNETLFDFLGETALQGCWDTLEAQDSRLVELLLRYFTTEARPKELQEQAGGMTLTYISQLLRQGVDILWQALPSSPTDHFPYEKLARYPRWRLRRGPTWQQQWAAGEASRLAWLDPERKVQRVYKRRARQLGFASWEEVECAYREQLNRWAMDKGFANLHELEQARWEQRQHWLKEHGFSSPDEVEEVTRVYREQLNRWAKEDHIANKEELYRWLKEHPGRWPTEEDAPDLEQRQSPKR